MNRIPRRQVMIDQQVQGALLARVALYWIICLGSMIGGTLVWAISTGPPAQRWTAVAAALVGLIPGSVLALLVLPWAISVVLRLSNRFVGPVYSLRNGLKRVLLGDSIQPIATRRHDYWADLLARFNELLPRVQRMPAEAAHDKTRSTGRV